MQNILFSGNRSTPVLGGQALLFTWPLESVDHLGNITNDTTGRAYILKAAIDWLAGPLKPLPGQVSNMIPVNNGTTTSLLPTFSWTAGIDATSYVINIGLGSTLPLSPVVIPVVTTSYTLTAGTSKIPPPIVLVVGATYTWRVDSVNANGTTLGPVQTFVAHAGGGGGGTTGTGTSTATGTGTGTGTRAVGGGGGGGSSCFSMTAYESSRRLAGIVGTNRTGSYAIAPEGLRQLNAIRALRDDLLMPFSSGRAFSAWYYAIGPYGAAAIRDNEPAKAAVRVMLLDPVAVLSRECAQAQRVVAFSGRPTVR